MFENAVFSYKIDVLNINNSQKDTCTCVLLDSFKSQKIRADLFDSLGW